MNKKVRKWKRYAKYKNSGVEWLGEIPEHWEVKKSKQLSLVKRGASPRPIDDPIYFDDNGEYSWVRISDVSASNKYLETSEQTLSKHGKSKSVPLEPGELFVSICATVGKPIITKIKCCIHDGFVYFPYLKENREYLFYIFLSGELYKGLGKFGTQLNLNTDIIGDIKLPIPSLSEQGSLASFLDRETAKIDTLIAKKERLIELLQEKGTALISHVVTKGLNPDVRMRNSGVEWLGEIPKHWEVLPLKFISTFISGATPSTTNSAYWDGSIPWITAKDMKQFYLTESTDYITELAVKETAIRVIPSPAVLVVVRGMILAHSFPVGLTTILVTINQDMKAIFLSKKLEPEYFTRQLLARRGAVLSLIQEAGHGTKVLRTDWFERLSILIPPFKEQQKIASYIKIKSSQIDNLIAKTRTSIELLKEYKTALISAAVTGKIDVREEVNS